MEFKDLVDLVQTAVSELHKAVERQDGEIKKLGEPSAESKAAIDKINAHIDELEVKLQRQSLPGAGSTNSEQKSDEEKARSAAFFQYMRGGIAAMVPDEKKALVEDTAGLYLVTPELDTEIVRSLPKITVIRPLATVRSINKESLKIRSISEVSVGWGKLETGGSTNESTLTPGAPTYQYAEDLIGLTKIGRDELADSDVNLQAILADSFTRAIAEAEDLAFVRGAGHGSEEPEGICINTTLIGNTVTSTAAGAVTFEKFMEMVYQCPAQYRRNGQWVVNSSVELALRQLRSETDATYKGRFLWEPSLIAGAPNTFLGYPIHNQDDMKELTDTTQVIAIFGDFKAGYRIIDREGITLERLGELYAEAGLVGFLVHKRIGGGVTRASQQPLVLMTEYV